MNWLHTILFPPRCPGCGRSVSSHGTWCSLCFQSVWHPRLVNGSRRNHLDGCYALTDYRGHIRRILQQIKYERKFQYEAACLYLLSRFPWMDEIRTDIAVPVPLSLTRLRKRGYNQSEFIFHSWAETFTVWSDVLQRRRATRSQWTLSRPERAENVADGFSVKYGMAVQGKTILLVDDIYTTGATLEACARALMRKGAARVTGLVIASGAP